MQKQKLQQNQKINISVEQIQFLNLLQIPAINLEQRIREELEDNPTLEIVDPIDEDDENQNQKLFLSSCRSLTLATYSSLC